MVIIIREWEIHWQGIPDLLFLNPDSEAMHLQSCSGHAITWDQGELKVERAFVMTATYHMNRQNTPKNNLEEFVFSLHRLAQHQSSRENLDALVLHDISNLVLHRGQLSGKNVETLLASLKYKKNQRGSFGVECHVALFEIKSENAVSDFNSQFADG
jgi:hypothetical protein